MACGRDIVGEEEEEDAKRGFEMDLLLSTDSNGRLENMTWSKEWRN